MSRITDVVKGIDLHLRTGVAAGAFTHAFDVLWGFNSRVPLEDLEDGTQARCDLVPGRSPFEMTSRVSAAYRFGIDVCLRARLKSPSFDPAGKLDVEECAEWLQVLEQINEYLAHPSRRRLSSVYQSAVWVDSEVAMPWVPSDHVELRQYTGILRVTYRVDVDQE